MAVHPPSEMRAIAQEAKHGRPLLPLLARARAIEDPGYVALALLAISQDPRLKLTEAAKLLPEIHAAVAATPRLWRRMELVDECGRRVAKWRNERAAPAEGRPFLSALGELVLAVPPGEERSAGIRAVAPWLPEAMRPALLSAALGNLEWAVDDAKEVLRVPPAPEVLAVLEASPAPLRARLFGFLHTQGIPATLPRALASARRLEGREQVEVLRAITASLDSPADLHAVAEAAAPDAETRARVLAAVAARADKLGDKPQAAAWFAEAHRLASSLQAGKAQATLLGNIGAGQRRLAGEPTQGTGSMDAPPAAADAPAPGPISDPPSAPPPPQRAVLPASPGRRAEPEALRVSVVGRPSARHWLGLYDAYEGAVKEVHLRAVARAAPLCIAFGLDLGLFGFPVQDLAAFVARAESETGIGEGARYIEELARAGRIHVVACTSRDPPSNLGDLGLAVATTPEPDEAKQADFTQAFVRGGEKGAARILLLMGLGPKGLPPSLLRAAPAHLEITGRRISLETATAMGILAERLRQLPPLPAGRAARETRR